MALDVAEFLWNKFLKSLAELESESNSGFVTISFFNSSIEKLVSKFKEIKDVVNERDIMPERYTYCKTIDMLYELNDVLAECRVIVHECQKSKSKLSSINPRRFISLNAIMEKLKTIQDKLQQLESSRHEIGYPLVVTRPTLSSEVFGFEDQSKEIEELLLGGSTSRSSGVRFTKIGVIGIAGVGKTTLVQKVLERIQRKEVKNNFGHIIWLPFSGRREGEQYSRFSFETCILEGDIKGERIVGLDSLLEILHQLLSGKSYLIVLDDVCFQLVNIMERLVSGLPKASGGAVIITSRLKEVAQKLGKHHHLVRVKPLLGEDCSVIFDKTIAENENKVPSILPGECLMKIQKMKDQCHGLPLVAKTLAHIVPETYNC